MSGFAPGDLVVCINARPSWIVKPPATTAFARLRQGGVYRVHRIAANDLGKVGIDIGVPNRDLYDGMNDIWPPVCFRKIEPSDEGFSQWMKTLRPTKVREPDQVETPQVSA